MRQYLQPNQVAQVVQHLYILVHPYVPSQGSLMCLPTRSHDHWGDTWRRAITWGELDMTVERTGMEGLDAGLLSDPLCMKEQEEHCQSPPKMASSRLLVCTSDQTVRNRLHEGGMRAAWGPDVLLWDLCSQTSTMQLDWHMPVNTRIGRSAIGFSFSSGIRAGSHWAHMTDLKESVNAMENIVLPTTSSSMTFWWWVSDGLGRNILGGSHRPPFASQQYLYYC